MRSSQNRNALPRSFSLTKRDSLVKPQLHRTPEGMRITTRREPVLYRIRTTIIPFLEIQQRTWSPHKDSIPTWMSTSPRMLPIANAPGSSDSCPITIYAPWIKTNATPQRHATRCQSHCPLHNDFQTGRFTLIIEKTKRHSTRYIIVNNIVLAFACAKDSGCNNVFNVSSDANSSIPAIPPLFVEFTNDGLL